MKIKIDCREKDLIKELDNLNFLEKEKLELGDVLIESDTNIILIERKTCSDLIGSILDGRFRDQKQRLLLFKEESQKNCFIVFLIEHNNYPVQFKRHLQSSLIHLNFLYDFKILYTRNIIDSADIIKHLIEEKFIKEDVIIKTSNDENLTSLKKYSKHCNYSNFVKMLSCIHGVSVNTSLAIEQNGITNISNLIYILQNKPEELESIIVGKRKLSKKIIEKLRQGLDL